MHRALFLRYYRLLFGLLGASAILTEITVLISNGNFNPINFFSYFTIESNILAVFVLIACGLSVRPSLSIRLLRGAMTLYMVMTGIIFAILLAGIENATLTAVPWDNIVLHYIMPIVVLADWFMDTPKTRISLKQAWVWLLFPIAYVVYSLIRGSITDWYPYPFLNPTLQGYDAVIITSCILAIGVLTASWLLCLTTQRKKPIRD